VAEAVVSFELAQPSKAALNAKLGFLIISPGLQSFCDLAVNAQTWSESSEFGKANNGDMRSWFP
jgi:hypothetical protein